MFDWLMTLMGQPVFTFFVGIIAGFAILTILPQRVADALTRKDRLGVALMIIAILMLLPVLFPAVTLAQLGIVGIIVIVFLVGLALSRRR